MKTETWILGPLALVAGLLPMTTPVALAQNSPATQNTAAQTTSKASAIPTQPLPTVVVWDAQGTNGTRFGPWGNGSAQVSRGRTGTTLLVTTLNLEEGVRFDLAKPIDLTPYRQTGFWQIKFQANAASQRGGRGNRNRAQGGTASPGIAPLTQLRLKLVLDQGVMSGLIPIGQANSGNRGNRGSQAQNLLLPLRNLSSSPGARGMVRRIILTGDTTASFNVDQIALVAETNRITATVRRASDPPGTDIKNMTLKPGRSTTLVADVSGGTSDLNVSWNFNADNSTAFPPAARGRTSTGARGSTRNSTRENAGAVRRRVDAEGLSARPNWPNEEQDYRVEVTITDRAGKKPAVKKSIAVQVRGGI